MPEPWARVKNPTPLPDRPQARALSRLDQESFAALIRDTLLPPATDDPREGQRRWRALWTLIAGHEPLRQRTVGVLEEWQQQATVALEQDELDPKTDRRVRKFVGKVDAQLRFLDARPAWRMRLNAVEDAALRQLVKGIASHRTILLRRGDTPGDHTVRMWGALEAVGLDPDRPSDLTAPPGYDGNLAWAGTVGERFTDPTAIAAIDYLVQAIHQHRTHKLQQRLRVSGTDRVTWASLRAVGLDPQRHYTVAGDDTAPASGKALEWAGPSVEELTPRDRDVLDALVDAIATHRATTDPDDDVEHDQDLWAALDEVGLDPSSQPWLTVPHGFTGSLVWAGRARAGLSPTGEAAAAYLVQSIVEHRAVELETEGLALDEIAEDDPCVVLWAVLDRLALDPLASGSQRGLP